MITKQEALDLFIRELVLEINMELTSGDYFSRQEHAEKRIKDAAVWVARQSAIGAEGKGVES